MTVGKTIKKVVMVLGVVALALFVTMIGQTAQYAMTHHDVQTMVLEQWQINNPESAHLADQYVTDCLMPHRDTDSDELAIAANEFKPFSAYECGKALGAEALIKELEVASASLTSLAWPLSELNDRL